MNYTIEVTEKFKKAVSAYCMLETDSILVGFSGGADSAVLLDLLSKHFATDGKRLVALHVNHMIRGADACRDEEFCRAFCAERGIEFHSLAFDIPALCKIEGIGTEECARRYRYEGFARFCDKHSIERIATAHNADDNFETILFNLSRGTSLSGVCGIPPVRGNIVRPIILCPKEEIIGYAKENGIPYVFDLTNNDTEYTRNYIRHRIVPAFREINPSVLNCISRFSESSRHDSEFLNSLASKYTDVSDHEKLCELETPILHRVISMKFEHTTNYKLEAVHIEAVAELIRSGKKNSSVSLPCGMQAVILGSELVFRPEIRQSAKPFYIELSEGENFVDSDRSVLLVLSDEEYKKYNLSQQILYKIFIHRTIDFDKIVGKLIARSKADGDSYRYGGMTRRLKKLFNNASLPVDERATIPVICDGNGILWVPGFGVRDDVKATPQSKNLCHIIYLKHPV